MFGTDVNAWNRSTRTRVGEGTGGLATTAAMRKAMQKQEAAETPEVLVRATQGVDGLYSLTVEASGQQTSVEQVAGSELAETIARLIQALTKAIRNGELSKARQRRLPEYGMGTPRSGKSNLRFG